GILFDCQWLIQVHARFCLLPETFFLCVNIRLLHVGAGWIARQASFSWHYVLLHRFQGRRNSGHCANNSYSESEILLAARYALKTVGWNSSFPNPVHFLRRRLNQQGRRRWRRSTDHWRVLLGGGTQMATFGYSSATPLSASNSSVGQSSWSSCYRAVADCCRRS
ncbi:putative cyclin 2, partial [Lanmaoa asiatica]